MTALATKKMTVDKAMSQLFPERDSPYTILRAAMKFPPMVQEEDSAEVFAELDKLVAEDPRRVVDLVVALCALVDLDRTPSQMLAWMCPVGEHPKPRADETLCGTVKGHVAHTSAGQEPCRPCQAAFLDAISECPSPTAYQRHKRRGEEPCEPCKEEMRAYWRTEYATKKRRTRGQPLRAKCGTRAGYETHKRAGEPQCDPCIEGNRTYFREWARKKNGSVSTAENAQRRAKPCETDAARRRHCRKREKCATCWPPGTPQPRWYQVIEDPAMEFKTGLTLVELIAA